MQRRRFMQLGAGLGLGGASLWPVGSHAWAATAPVQGRDAPRRLVVVFLRGAVDGLSVVVPYGEPGYGRARSSIALARPGSEGGVLDLDGRFGLHPALAPLMPLWQGGRLGFVHASGSPDTTRSHFDAQDYMESGTPGAKSTADGWMSRVLAGLPGAHETLRAVSVGAVMPRIYAGAQGVSNMPSGAAAARPTVLDRPRIEQAFAQLYDGDDRTSRAYRDAQTSRREMHGALQDEGMDGEMRAANNGAPLPNGFPADAARLATLMRRDPHVQLGFIALGGWDTHANQGNARGQLAARLDPLGRGLAELASRLGPVFDDTLVVVMSEFGRTVAQNGNGGTDHGHANVMWLLGGGVKGGKVHGRWPGLDAAALYEQRDLAITTDFREVLLQASERHLRCGDAQLARLFPGYAGPRGSVDVLRG